MRITRWLAPLVAASALALGTCGLALAQQDQQPGAPSPASTRDWWQWQSTVGLNAQVAAEIAYQRYWQLQSDVAESPDDPDGALNLSLAEDGAALDRDKNELNQLNAAGQAKVVRVENHPTVTYSDDQQSVIIDEYLDSSYLVDASSGAPVGDGPNTAPATVHMAVLLQKLPDQRSSQGSFIKVVDSVRIEPR